MEGETVSENAKLRGLLTEVKSISKRIQDEMGKASAFTPRPAKGVQTEEEAIKAIAEQTGQSEEEVKNNIYRRRNAGRDVDGGANEAFLYVHGKN